MSLVIGDLQLAYLSVWIVIFASLSPMYLQTVNSLQHSTQYLSFPSYSIVINKSFSHHFLVLKRENINILFLISHIKKLKEDKLKNSGYNKK